MLDRKNLIRVVRISENNYCVDRKNKFQGRSAYICKVKNCFERSKKIRGFEHSFKSKFACEIYKELENEFKKIL